MDVCSTQDENGKGREGKEKKGKTKVVMINRKQVWKSKIIYRWLLELNEFSKVAVKKINIKINLFLGLINKFLENKKYLKIPFTIVKT